MRALRHAVLNVVNQIGMDPNTLLLNGKDYLFTLRFLVGFAATARLHEPDSS